MGFPAADICLVLLLQLFAPCRLKSLELRHKEFLEPESDDPYNSSASVHFLAEDLDREMQGVVKQIGSRIRHVDQKHFIAVDDSKYEHFFIPKKAIMLFLAFFLFLDVSG